METPAVPFDKKKYMRDWARKDYAAHPEKYRAKNRARRVANIDWRARKRGLQSAADRIGPCDICGVVVRRVWDHDHATGATRGWLCSNCNTALGLLGDDPVRLEAAIYYLRKDTV